MKFKLSIILVLFFQTALFCQNSSNYDFSKIENDIRAAIKNQLVPSVAIAVSKNGNIIYEKAFGLSDIENNVKATAFTSYQLASVSKPMTATGIMILKDQGLIDIESPVGSYISPLVFKSFDGNTNDVSLKHILNHTSGLGTYFQLDYKDENHDYDDFETAFSKYGYIFHSPGLIFEYSNLGYGLLNYIIEKKSEMSFANFMKKELFEPLGMLHSFVSKPEASDLIIARKYNSNLQLLPEISINTKGAGSIYSSAHDLLLFGMFHLKNTAPKLIDSNDIDLMHSYINKNSFYHYYDSTYYGLGWYFKPNDNGCRIVWHEGGMMGASSMIKLIPDENIAIAVVLNVSNQQLCQQITDEIGKAVLPTYNPKPNNEIAEYQHYTSDSTYFGKWKGIIKVDTMDIPCTLNIQSDGNIVINYLDYTYKSYFTQNNPIPHKTFLLSGLVNKNSFIGAFPGDLPSVDIRHEMSQFMSLKLYKNGNILSGSIVAMAAGDREHYAYPYYIRLERQY